MLRPTATMSIAITTLIKFKKMKKIIYFLIASSPMLAWAQQNVITYNPVDKQVLLTEVNAENNLETLVVIDEQDFNTVQYDKDGRVTELTNSLGTLAFEYEDNCINVTYNIDGQILSRHVYYYQDTKEYAKLTKLIKDWAGTLNTTDRVVNFMNSDAFKSTYEFLDNTFDGVSNPVKALYENVLRKAVYGEKKDMNGMDEAFDDMISLVLKMSEGVKDNIKDAVFTNPRKYFDKFVSYVYNLHKEKYNRQKANNNFKMSWREGLWEKVVRNEITIEEATAKVAEVMAKKEQYEKEHPNEFADILIEMTTDEQTGEEKIEFREVAKTSDDALLESSAASAEGDADLIFKKLDNYINHSEYGRLDNMFIYYNYYKSTGPEEWTYKRHPSTESGKLTLQRHSPPLNGASFGVEPSKWKNPFYKVELYYENDVDYSNWGTVMVRLWLTPSGSILNTYIMDYRHQYSDEVNIPTPKITGSDWLNLVFD